MTSRASEASSLGTTWYDVGQRLPIYPPCTFTKWRGNIGTSAKESPLPSGWMFLGVRHANSPCHSPSVSCAVQYGNQWRFGEWSAKICFVWSAGVFLLEFLFGTKSSFRRWRPIFLFFSSFTVCRRWLVVHTEGAGGPKKCALSRAKLETTSQSVCGPWAKHRIWRL